MNKRAAVLARLTVLIIGGGFGLYGQYAYQSLQRELSQRTSECMRLPAASLERIDCVMGAHSLDRDVDDAEEMRNVGFAVAIGGPLAIWLLGLLWPVVSQRVQRGAMQGAKAGRVAVDELSKRSARATKDVVGAVAQISDSAQGRTRECPFCAEMIKPQAKVCRHCGNDVG